MTTPDRIAQGSGRLGTLRRRGRWLGLPLTALLALALAGQNTAAVAAPADWQPPKPRDVTGVAVRNVKPAAAKPVLQPPSVDGPQRVTWPAAGTAQAQLSGAAVPKSLQAASDIAASAARAGNLPVRIAPAPSGTKIAGRALTASDAPARVAVTLHDKAAAERAGVSGLLLSVGHADKGRSGGAVSVTLDYSGFAKAYGGDWATRLRLVQMPGCVVSRPADTGCRVATPLASLNNAGAQTLTATAPLVAAGTILAAESGTTGDNGDYSATDLSSAGTWEVSKQTGDFSWSVPVRVPELTGAVAPSIGLGYSSGSVDGLTGSTNTQGGWVGDGWSMWPGFIERTYTSCAQDNPGHKTGDLCWFNDNATISLNGRAGQLIQDGSLWRMKNDDGTKVERLSDTARDNGDDNDEYWKVTTPDGVQYFFGHHKLPGWTAGKPVTDSVWTAPVFGNNTNDPCHGDTFDTSDCAQAWRWNLDYVVDPRGNSLAYFYGKETGAYGRDMDPDDRSTYQRGGYLKRAEYGMRAGAEYQQAAPLRVTFDTAERCKSGCWTGAAWDSTPVKSAWPDTPWDQYCEEGASCAQNSPTFWSARRLTEITTQKRTGATSYTDIESWTLRHDFLNAGTGESTPMWLAGITHAGRLQQVAGDPNQIPAAPTPEMRFGTGAEPLHNRVDAVGDQRTALARWRIKQIRNESGGELIVTYSPESDCTRDKLPDPDRNTTRCMPAYYSWPGTGDPTLDWFHKYVVTRVDQNDLVTDQPSTTTFFDYLEAPAWHYHDDEITKDKYKTWGDWRGYAKVRVRTGTEAGAQSTVEYHYLRGMNGDELDNGAKRSVSVSDWGGTVVDHEALNGFLRQEIRYNGVPGSGATEVSSTVNQPWWRGPTATRTRNGVTTNAYMVHTGKSRTRTVLAAGGYRYQSKTSTFNDDGLATKVDDTGDEAAGNDQSCIRNTYAPNTGTWMLDKVVMSEKLSVSCTGAPATVVSRTRNFYDRYTGEASFGAAPSKGNLVRVEELDSWSGTTPAYVRTSSTVYDAVGRATSQTNARGHTTSTEYGTANGGLVTQTVIKNPLGHSITTVLEPAWGVPATINDQNGVTTLRYDALGRLAAVWLPGHSTTGIPDLKYGYAVRQSGGPSSVTTEELLPTGTATKKAVALYDGFLRQRQEQKQATGGGRLLTDTFYNTRGDVDWISEAYYDSTNAAVSTAIGRPQGQIPALTQITYDGAGRETVRTLKTLGAPKWKTTTTYGGDRTSVTPPDGGTATTSLTDVFGRTTALRQYKKPADVGKDDPALFDASFYTYDAAGNLTGLKDAASNVWSTTYDLRGRRITDKDPDRGTTRTTYDAAGNIETVTDNLNQVVAYTYDQIGRRTSIRNGSVTGTKRAEWTYDTLPHGIGKLTKSIRFAGGAAYENRIDAYDTTGRVTGSSLALPTSAGSLCASETTAPCVYSTAATFKANGVPATTTAPKVAGLAKEKLTFGYNDIGDQTTVLSPIQIYVQTATYDKLGLLTGRTLGNTGSRIALTSTYDEPTRRLTSANVVPELKSEAVNYGYEYNDAGFITKITDTAQGKTPDTQCFSYDYLNRLTTARTTAAADCKAKPSLSNLGVSAPYWHQWAYDVTGNRTKETRYAATGNTVTDYTYPAPGPTSTRPHAVTAVKTTAAGQTGTRGFTYDALGNTKTRPATSGDLQTLTWDREGHLESLVEAGKKTSFIYDADGNRLIRKTPTGNTLYLPDGSEVFVAAGSSTATGTRYYSHKSTPIAMRTGAGLTWVIADHNGTAELTIAASTLAVTKRRTLPFGEPRTNPTTWPTAFDKGFVGGTKDPTGLTHLGAREYDPALARFISVDPLLNTADPGSWNGYAYAGNSPISASDADGLSCKMDDGSQCGPAQRTPSTTTTTGGGGDGNNNPVGTATIDYTDNNSYVCVSGYWCMDQHQVPKPTQYINAYQAELARMRAQYGLAQFEDHNYATAMYIACGVSGEGNCSSQMLTELNFISGAANTQAFEAKHGVNKKTAALAAGFATLEAVAGLPSCVLKGTIRTGGKSFSGDTPVLMADGTTKKIDDIQAGDEVIATDPETGLQGPKTVTSTWVHDDDLYTLRIDGSKLATTEDHPFWSATDRTWQRADNLQPGALLRTPEGKAVPVDGLDPASHHVGLAYNLTVDELHTYYVLAGKTPVLVHNCGNGMSSAIGQDSFLAKAAQQAGRNQRVQQEMDGLFKQLGEGNMNPGIGSKSLSGTDVSYARGRNGARLFFRNVDGGVQIVGKADKGNESAVIRRLTELYGQ